MSESRYREAYTLGFGDGVCRERERFNRVERPLWFLAGAAAGLLAMIAIALAGLM